MIRLNKMTDYAVVVLSHMASNSTGNCATKGAAEGAAVTTAVQMAQDCGVPLPSVSKLLKQLAKAGILSSHRGAGGGLEPIDSRSRANVSTNSRVFRNRCSCAASTF